MNTSNDIKKYVIIGIVVIVAVFFAVYATSKKSTSEVSSTTASSTQKNVVVSTGTAQSQAGTATKPAPAVSTVQNKVNTNYVDYVTNLGIQRNNCADASLKQYKPYMSILEQSAFTDYYNEKTGVCYAKITGTLHPAYSTTTGAIYFRNVTKNTLLAECVNTKNSFADGDWQCIDKSTNRSMGLPEFNGYIRQLI